MNARIVKFVAIIQSILFFGHWLVYETWISFTVSGPREIAALRVGLALLSISFVLATFLAFRSGRLLVRLFYRIAAVWLGMLNFFFLAACLCWAAYLGASILGLHLKRPATAAALFCIAFCVSIYGIVNAMRIRVKRITIKLPNLPDAWSGRTAAMVSDLHLGHINGKRLMQRVLDILRRLNPQIVFIVGDLYDGTKMDPEMLAAPWKNLSAPLGAYFVTGNHEEFFSPENYLEAVAGAGIHVLNNEKVSVDGLQLIGIRDRDLTNPGHLESILQSATLDSNRASVLLAHRPEGMAIAEKQGISLQLSGHTHCGQVFPFTWFTKRIFRQYTYGLNQFGALVTYTSSGVGAWGPPMRVGSHPEIVLFTFE